VQLRHTHGHLLWITAVPYAVALILLVKLLVMDKSNVGVVMSRFLQYITQSLITASNTLSIYAEILNSGQ
jgi:hypothetical protein